ncbi:MAG TPA: hypothetical protein VKZ96_05190 [Thermomicrobiales bacterium]|nr:hypothetical protein [Thermomicrobiales bacterium]
MNGLLLRPERVRVLYRTGPASGCWSGEYPARSCRACAHQLIPGRPA